MVFDSSAIYQGYSLNSTLLQGPDLTNNLLGVLLRFRKERVAITGDIEQMFHMFHIDKEHRNFVRFIWFKDNDPTKFLQDYRMCVHLFRNSPSPAVATYCLHRCVEEPCDIDVKYYVTRNFYVDDGLSSYDTDNEALEILLRTQQILRDREKIRFHKFASNSQIVMDSLPPEDRAKDSAERNELHTFADASVKAISAVTYIKVINKGTTYLGFVTGKSKLAPHHGHTVPRLELCAALFATEIASFVENQLDSQIHDMRFYTDSRVVLGYLYNKTRRFHTYVSNRVQRILTNSKTEQWTFVASDQNPADVGTRSIPANELATSSWLTGPKTILDHNQQDSSKYPLLDPDNDCEIKKTVTVVKTNIHHGLNTNMFTRFSTWNSLIRGLSFMRSAIRQKLKLQELSQTKLYQSMEKIVIKSAQFEAYGQDIERLKEHKPVTKGSLLQSLTHIWTVKVCFEKLRRKVETQKIGNLPDFPCKQSPPFTYVGVDTFGPWEVTARNTRGEVANAKRLGILHV
ncbi:uncharacterized protein LOC134254258 [Saccostrea cucullata]|uniref:uncharacterized protein LOC134254258 n=1 Tax=Saccostrea cuccullata TaxID=36930 RepID=UPI002ED6003C